MIAAEDIEVVFHPGGALETTALRGVSVHIDEGEFVTVVGSNGAGKSTLLGVLAGDITPTTGKVMFAGKDMTTAPAHQRAANIARVFQDPLAGTCAAMSVEENMALAATRGKQRGWAMATNSQRREMFRERLSPLGLNLENRLNEKVGQLSGGQRQAISLVMATLSDARVLLLDEHTAALDPRMAAFVLELTRTLCAQYHLSVLMVTHSMKAALSCGVRTLMLHRGKIALDIGGDARAGMTAADLLHLFAQNSGADDDRLLLETT